MSFPMGLNEVYVARADAREEVLPGHTIISYA
jgi:hypothetical protein